MKNWLSFSLLLVVAALPLHAEDTSVGLMLGAGQSVREGGFHVNDPVREIFFSTDTDPATTLKLKVGHISLDENRDGVDITRRLDYVDVLVEYKLDEVWGSSGLFGGVGLYREDVASGHDTDYGFSAGLNGTFPVTRRLAFLAEAAYHSARFKDRATFVTVTAGLKLNF
ncbi:MAG TPA: hypothetical protein VHL58_01460 [Thermoanaerobaculia bacterium]|nr:hypothetical protein [Thermoanaerobaculia bacterium]